MSCNAPLSGWYSKEKTPLGKRGVTFHLDDALADRPVNIRCGQCYGCKLDKARDWSLRCSHEAQMHESSLFVTLTYENPPSNCGEKCNHTGETLRPRDFVNFMKRLRKSRTGQKIRFFHCGEYGERTLRPHHHALLFNLSFSDSTRCRKSGDYYLYRSEELNQLWQHGKAEFGEVNFRTASYIARYTLKNARNPKGSHPDYLTMSRRPGIGRLWLQKFTSDVYPNGQCITPSGTKVRAPRYYDQQLEPQLLSQVQAQRFAVLTPEQLSGLRKSAREKILRAKQRALGSRDQL